MCVNFKPAKTIRANYPYLVKLGGDDDQATFTIQGLKADTRDYQSYVFRTPSFEYKGCGKEEVNAKYGTNLDEAYLYFCSTAPIFNMYNKSISEVEVIDGVKNNSYTRIEGSDTQTDRYNYYFYQGGLYPAETAKNLKSGLAYIQMSPDLYKVFSGQTREPGAQMLSLAFDLQDETTDISAMRNHVQTERKGIFNLIGQKVGDGDDLTGLPTGLYIRNGKKFIIR